MENLEEENGGSIADVELKSGDKQEDKASSLISANLAEDAVQEGRSSPPLTVVVTINDEVFSENDCTEDTDGKCKSRIPILVRRNGTSPAPLNCKPTSRTIEQISILKQEALTATDEPLIAPHEIASEGFTQQQQTELIDQLLQVEQYYKCSDSLPQTLNPDIQESPSPKICRAGSATPYAKPLETSNQTNSPDKTSLSSILSSLVSPTRVSDDSSPQISLGEPTAELKTMSDHPSYHSNVSGRQAEEILKKHGGACYLTRHSKSNNCYVLSVLRMESRGARISHFMLKINKQSLYGHHVTSEIEGTNLQFSDIFKLLQFYEKNPVNHEFRNIGAMIRSDEHKEDYQHAGKPISSEVTGISYFTVSKPTLSDLIDMSWSEGGCEKHFKLTKEISGAWREAGLILGISTDTLDDYKQNCHGQWNHSCMERILNHWLNNGHPNYPPTWDGLFSLLNDLERRSTIDILKTALSRRK